jgi:hypothetical protein
MFPAPYGEYKAKGVQSRSMDEGRKRVIGIMAAILASLHMQTARTTSSERRKEACTLTN